MRLLLTSLLLMASCSMAISETPSRNLKKKSKGKKGKGYRCNKDFSGNYEGTATCLVVHDNTGNPQAYTQEYNILLSLESAGNDCLYLSKSLTTVLTDPGSDLVWAEAGAGAISLTDSSVLEVSAAYTEREEKKANGAERSLIVLETCTFEGGIVISRSTVRRHRQQFT